MTDKAKNMEQVENKAPRGYTKIEGGELKVGYLVWNIGGAAKNGSVPSDAIVEKITNITKAANSGGKPYVKLHLESTKAPKTKRTKFASKAKAVYAKAPKTTTKAPTKAERDAAAKEIGEELSKTA